MYDKEEDITISQVTIMNPEATKVSQSINSQSMIAKGNAEKPIENKDVKEVKLPNKSVKKRDETIHPTKLKFTEENIALLVVKIKNMSNKEKDDKHKNNRQVEEITKEKHKEKIKSKDDKDQIKIDSKKYNKEIEKKNLKDYNKPKSPIKKHDESERKKRKRNSEIKKEFFEKYVAKLDEELDISKKQIEIIDFLEISYKRHKGNRSLILIKELTSLKDIPMKYKEVELNPDVNIDDLDVSSDLGERVIKTENGYIWKQVDISSMKEEKKNMLAMKREQRIIDNEKIILSLEGQDKIIGDRNIHKRNPISKQSEGRVRILYHGKNGPLNIYAIDILKDGEYLEEIKEDKMVIMD